MPHKILKHILLEGPIYKNRSLVNYAFGNKVLNNIIELGILDYAYKKELKLLNEVLNHLSIFDKRKREEKKKEYLYNLSWIKWRKYHFKQNAFASKNIITIGQELIKIIQSQNIEILCLFLHTQTINLYWYSEFSKRNKFTICDNNNEDPVKINEVIKTNVDLKSSNKQSLISQYAQLRIDKENSNSIVYVALDGNENNTNTAEKNLTTNWKKLINDQTAIFLVDGYLEKNGKFKARFYSLDIKNEDSDFEKIISKQYLDWCDKNFQYLNYFGLKRFYEILLKNSF